MRTFRQGSSSTRIVILFVLFLFLAAIGFTLVRAKKGWEQVVVPHQSTAGNGDLTIADHFDHRTPINILLLGYGGGDHEGTYLTDSMMVIHLDLKQKIASLISIPRDIWVKMPTDNGAGAYGKINSAYAIGLDPNNYPFRPDQFKGEGGGGALAKYAVEKVTGLPIDRFIAVDFKGFEEAINLLGGVDINVEKTFDDPEYPIDGRENDLCGHKIEELPDLEKMATISAVTAFPCRYENLHFDVGPNHMDGTRALKFVRSRHSLQDGTDFGRSNRQRNLLLAVKEKVVSLNFITKILPTLDILKDHFRTDLSLPELQTFLSQYPQLNSFTTKNLALTIDNVLDFTFSSDGQYILIPDVGAIDDWNAIHHWVSERLDTSKTITTPVIKVENDSPRAGLAELAANNLKAKGLIVATVTTGTIYNLTKTTISVFNSRIDSKILDQLKEEFSVSRLQIDTTASNPYDILIAVGQDYAKPAAPATSGQKN